MIGKTIIELSRVDSTNAYANRLSSAGKITDGTIILAHEQFAGRGLGENRWNSEPGRNLTLTVCLKPRFLPPDRQFHLNKAIALGVLDFIRASLHPGLSVTRHPSPVTSCHPSPVTCHPSLIKWPNDIYVGNRKIAGILIENMIMGSRLETSLAGIGININQVSFSPDLPNPVSLCNLTGIETDLKEALFALCRFLNKRYKSLMQDDLALQDQEFDRNLLGFDEWKTFIRDGIEVEGMIKGVDNTGKLMLGTRSGEIQCYSHGQIAYVI